MKSEDLNKLSKNFNEMARAIGNEIEQVDLQIKKYFIELEDTPDIYQADRFLVTDEQGIQFKDIDAVSTNITDNIVQNELLDFTGLKGTPDLYHNGKYLRSTNNSIEYIDATGIAQDISDEIVNVIVNDNLLAFTGLQDTPTGYSGDYFLKSTEDSIEYISLEDITKVISTEMNDEGLLTFTGLQDTPTGYSGDYFLKSTEDSIEYISLEDITKVISTEMNDEGLLTFTGLQDTPTGYSGDYFLKSTEDSIEYISSTGMAAALTEKIVDTIIEEELLWINGSIDITGAFTGLSDTPTEYKDGFFLKSSSTGLEYISLSDLASNLSSEITDPVLDFTGLQDTPDNYVAGSFIQVSNDKKLEYINETNLTQKIVDKIVDEELLWINGEINITGNFTGLSDTPDSYAAGSYLRSTADGVEYVAPTGVAKDIGDEIVDTIIKDNLLAFTGLKDTPENYTDGSYLRSTADGVEYVAPTGVAKDIGDEIVDTIIKENLLAFTGLKDTPENYTDGSYLRSTADGVEYVAPTGVAKDIGDEIVDTIIKENLLAFTGLKDTPENYTNGSYLRSTADGVEYVAPTGVAKDIGDEIVDTIIKENLLTFTGLKDTDSVYQDGYFLKSSATGIEYSQVVENVTELPAEIIDGQLLSLECELYVGCNGEWKSLGSPAAPETETLPGCVTDLSEAVAYQEYKDKFLAENMGNTFDQMLNFDTNISDSIYDVCLFSDNSRSEVKIDETTYKWGMFADTQTVNITATPGTASDRKIEFNYWAGDGAVFGDANNPQTTLVVDKDLSVTGYFTETMNVPSPLGDEITVSMPLSEGDVGLTMLWLAADTFTMGDDNYQQYGNFVASPAHEVTFTKGFYVGKYPITQAQYEQVMTGNVWKSSANTNDTYSLSAIPSYTAGRNRPVEQVSWADAQKFLIRLNDQQADQLPPGWSYTLPTEAQWEYAARAGSTVNKENDFENQLGEVGLFPENAWGFSDMTTNVYEWIEDGYGDGYPSEPVTDPWKDRYAIGNIFRLYRGWWSPATRHGLLSDERRSNLGFRIALQYTGDNLEDNKELEMAWIEPGTFMMGSPETESGRNEDETQHEVTLTRGFYMSKHEITQAQWRKVMAGNTEVPHLPTIVINGYRFDYEPNHPVGNVSWDDVQVFLARLNEQEADNLDDGWSYALPTEAQWEYACRAGTTTPWSTGNTLSTSQANIGQTNSSVISPKEVGSYPANPWGLFDMHGNSWEWVRDTYNGDPRAGSSTLTRQQADYDPDPQTDPFNEINEYGANIKIRRGGSWWAGTSTSRSAMRWYHQSNHAQDLDLGFRIILEYTGH